MLITIGHPWRWARKWEAFEIIALLKKNYMWHHPPIGARGGGSNGPWCVPCNEGMHGLHTWIQNMKLAVGYYSQLPSTQKSHKF